MRQGHKRIDLLGAPVDCLTMEQAGARVAEMIEGGQIGRVITLNPEILYRTARAAGSAAHDAPDAVLLDLIKRADLVTADGEGILWAARMAGTPLPQRVTGIDLMLHLVREAAARGWRIYLLGAAPGVAREAADNLCRRFPGLQLAGVQHGYYRPEEEEQVVREAISARPQLLFVALGAPRQELWIDRYLAGFAPGVAAVGVGGSFDVIAGRVARAPRWMQRMKLEWLGRLLREPSRWRRMLVLPRFARLTWQTYRLRAKGR